MQRKFLPATAPLTGPDGAEASDADATVETDALALSRDWTDAGAPVLTDKEKRIFVGRVAPDLRADDGHRPVTTTDREGKPSRVLRLKDVRHGIAQTIGVQFDVETGTPEYAICEGCQRPFKPVEKVKEVTYERRYGKESMVRKVKIKTRARTREARNCPDCYRPFCAAGCGVRVRAALMQPSLVRKRGGNLPYCSIRCQARASAAAKTPEQRSEIARKAQSLRTPEQRGEASRKWHPSRTPEQRSEISRKWHAAKTPEQRSEVARKWNAARTPEQRSDAVRRARAALTPEQQSDATRKMLETRRANAAKKGPRS